MIYLLDTNVCIVYLNNRSSRVSERLRALSPSDVTVCSVVKAELFYGAMRSRHPDETLLRQRAFLQPYISLPFEDRAAEFYAGIRADLEAKGIPIGPNDLMIASIALANNLTLVTANTGEFSRVEALRFEDWERMDLST
jgi:tRNA(fMet)-specific endonuclease VapC